jgi:hypothetical protein
MDQAYKHTLNYAYKHLPKTKITPPNINAREKSIDPFSTLNKEQGHQKRGWLVGIKR